MTIGARVRRVRAYASERRVFYSSRPTAHYGFCVTGPYFSDDIYPFASDAQRARFIRAVAGRTSLTAPEAYVAAALAAFTIYADDAKAQAYCFILSDSYPEQSAAILAAAESFLRRRR